MELSPPDKFQEIQQLADAELEGEATAETGQRLVQLVRGDSAAADLYVKYIYETVSIRWWAGVAAVLPGPDSPVESHSASRAISGAHLSKDDERVPPRQIIAVLGAAAAIFFGCVFSFRLLADWRLNGGGHASTAAVIDASINAQWGDMQGDGKPGSDKPGNTRSYGVQQRLPQQPIALKSGVIRIVFESGAQVTIEGPAEFSADYSNRMSLFRGKLTAVVPPAARGFSVYTADSVVTDLGTEFAVAVDDRSQTHVEVFKGRVSITPISGNLPVTLTAGGIADVQSGMVSAALQGAMPQRFVTNTDQKAATLDLVDMISGGDGTTQRRGMAIDAMGNYGVLPPVRGYNPGSEYHRVPGLPIADGCFLPSGATAVDSAGDKVVFPTSDHPSTHNHIWAGGHIPWPADDIEPVFSTTLQGVDYSQPNHGLLTMHSNKGLTLDLTVVSRLHPGCIAREFSTVIGNTYPPGPRDKPDQMKDPKYDIFLIVDGKIRYQRMGIRQSDGAFKISVPLTSADRFLTFAVTDGGDNINCDWVIFGDPQIAISPL